MKTAIGDRIDAELGRLESELGKRLGLDAQTAAALLHGRDADGLSAARSLALIGLDADGVQAHLLSSPRPVTIRGASHRLDVFDKEVVAEEAARHGAVVLYAGGGQATLLAPIGRASEVCAALVARFHEVNEGARLTAVQQPISLRELVRGPAASDAKLSPKMAERLGLDPEGGGGFGGCMANLAFRLKLAKGAARDDAELREPLVGPRCGECARRPRAPGKGTCARCGVFRVVGGKLKRGLDEAQTFEDLLKPARRIAFVAADGSSIGGVLSKLRTVAQYKAFSIAMAEAFQLDFSAEETARALRLPYGGRHQLVTAGGDDLLMVLPDHWHDLDGVPNDALSFAADLVRHVDAVFEDPKLLGHFGVPAEDGAETNQDGAATEARRAVAGIGIGIGVIVTSGLPASSAFDYAKALIKTAKSAARKAEQRSGVDFRVITGGSPVPDGDSVSKPRKAKLELGRLYGDVRLERRPFAAPEFREFLEVVRACQRQPRSSVYGLREAFEDPSTGWGGVCYQLARHRGLREALLGSSQLQDPLGAPGGWVLREHERGDYSTAIPDLVEAMKVVTAEGEA